MHWLSAAILSLSFSAVAVGVIETLLPSNSFKNQMRLITGAVLIISILSPFIGGINFDLPSFDSAAVRSADVTERTVAAAARAEITLILEEEGVAYREIIIHLGRDENDSIILSGASIVLSENGQNPGSAILKIEEKFDIYVETEVI